MIDSQLTAKLPHLKHYPNYFPSIGANYSTTGKKVFIILESHYLKSDYDGKFTAKDWYNNPNLIKSIINEVDFEMCDTRVNVGNFQKRLKANNVKGHYTVYNKIQSAFGEVNHGKRLFEEVVFFNYYQRPSLKKGETIVVEDIDRQEAFLNLLVLNELLEPYRIIFASSKAYNDFKESRKAHDINIFPPASYVPHPSSRGNYWAKPVKSYGKNQDGSYRTGEQKFKDILKSIYK